MFERLAEKRPGSMASALAHRDFRLLISGLSISTLGDWLYNVGLQVFVFTATHSAAWVAASTIFRLLPSVVLGALGGVVADRFDRRRVLIASDLTRAVLMASLAVVAFAMSSPAVAIALAFMSTVAGTPYMPAVAAMTPSIVTERDLAAANAVIETVNSVAVVAGPAIGGVLLAVGSPAVGFAINGASFVVSALAVSRVRLRMRATRSDVHPGLVSGILDGVRAVRASGNASLVLLFYACSGFTYGLGTVLFILASQQLLGTGAEGYGYLLAALGLGSVLAIAFTGRLAAHPAPAIPLTLGLLLTGMPFAALAAVRQPAFAFLLLILMGMGGVVVDVLSITLLQRSIRPELIGRVFGLAASIGVGVILFGSILAPILVAAVGLRLALVIGGLSLPLLTLVALPRTRRLTSLAEARLRSLAPRVEVLSAIPIFSPAPRESLEALAAELLDQDVAAGDVVVRQGEPADDVFVVVSGTLEVRFASDSDATPRVVNTLGPGDYFGEIGVVEEVPRTASVVALSPCHLYRIRGADFLAAVTRVPAISGPLRDSMAGRLARTQPVSK